MTPRDCPLCDGDIYLSCADHEGYVEGSTYQIYCCKSCATSFAAPLQAGAEVYDFIYRNSDRVPGYNRYYKYASAIKKAPNPLAYLADAEEIYFGLSMALRNMPVGKLKILEVGSGLGYTTYALSRAGIDARGIDLSQEAVNRAISNFGPLYQNLRLSDLAMTEAGKFDLVVATEVLEHVENPLKFVQEIMPLVKEGGGILLTTPRKYREFPTIWDTDLPPVHLWWFTVEGMQALAAKANLVCEFIDTSSHRSNWIKPYQPPSGAFRRKSFVSRDFELIDSVSMRKKISALLPTFLAKAILISIAIVKSYFGARKSQILPELSS